MLFNCSLQLHDCSDCQYCWNQHTVQKYAALCMLIKIDNWPTCSKQLTTSVPDQTFNYWLHVNIQNYCWLNMLKNIERLSSVYR